MLVWLKAERESREREREWEREGGEGGGGTVRTCCGARSRTVFPFDAHRPFSRRFCLIEYRQHHERNAYHLKTTQNDDNHCYYYYYYYWHFSRFHSDRGASRPKEKCELKWFHHLRYNSTPCYIWGLNQLEYFFLHTSASCRRARASAVLKDLNVLLSTIVRRDTSNTYYTSYSYFLNLNRPLSSWWWCELQKYF